MGRKCLDKNKRGNKYIRVLNEDNWLIIERLEKLPKYKNSFNKIANDAFDYGLPLLLKAEFGEEVELENQVPNFVPASNPRVVVETIDDRQLEEIIRLLEELVLNSNVTKSVVSSLLNAKIDSLYGKNVRADKLEDGAYRETPLYLSDYEARIQRRLREMKRR